MADKTIHPFGEADYPAVSAVESGVVYAFNSLTGTLAAGGAELHTGQTTVYDSDGDDATKDGTAKSYTDNGDGTVTDNHTGLIWQKDHKDAGATLNWAAAIDYAATLENGVDGLTDSSSLGDWRVPSYLELATLADMDYPSSSYLNSVFTQTNWGGTCFGYWSSTTVPSNNTFAYYLSVSGSIGYSLKATTISYGVRCVRNV